MNNIKNKSQILIRPMLRREIQVVKEWFNIPTFYFDTFKPEIIKEEEIDFFLEFHASNFCIIEEKRNNNKTPVALLDYTTLMNSGKTEIELQFINYDDWQRIGSIVLKEITTFILENCKVNKILKMIYGFEEETIKIFAKNGFKCEGKYSSLIYKNSTYWDVFVYSRFEFNERNLNE